MKVESPGVSDFEENGTVESVHFTSTEVFEAAGDSEIRNNIGFTDTDFDDVGSSIQDDKDERIKSLERLLRAEKKKTTRLRPTLYILFLIIDIKYQHVFCIIFISILYIVLSCLKRLFICIYKYFKWKRR